MSAIVLETVPIELRMSDSVKLELLVLSDSKPAVDMVDRVGRLIQERRILDIAKQHVQAAIDFCWEKLNSGYWKDVPVAWRKLYAHASLLKAVCILSAKDSSQMLTRDRWKRALAACDMGLLMGFPIQKNVLSTLATRLSCLLGQSGHAPDDDSHSDCISKRPRIGSDEQQPVAVEEPSISYPIPLVQPPSLEHFRAAYMATKTPIVIGGGIDHWPALGERQWSTAYLKKVSGYRTIPIELGTRYTDESWSQSLMTLSGFLDKYVDNVSGNQPTGYLAQHPLFEQIPELRRDICIPDYCCLSDKPMEELGEEDNNEDEDAVINAWFGPSGTVSPLHHDPKHNLLAQVVGSKYIRLYGEDQTPFVYPHEGTMLFNTSQVDVENPDLEQFPEFGKARFMECILRAGEMLYIPPRCWHFVKSLTLSFSVSFWWC